MIQKLFKILLTQLKSKFILFLNQQNLRVFIQILLLLNLTRKNKNLHLIENSSELLRFKTKYIKDVTGKLERLSIQEKITTIVSIKENKIGLQKLKSLSSKQELETVQLVWYYFLRLSRYHEVKEKYQEQYLIFLMSQVRLEDFWKVLLLFFFFWSALQQNIVFC